MIIIASEMLSCHSDDVEYDCLFGKLDDEDNFDITNFVKYEEYAVYMYVYI